MKVSDVMTPLGSNVFLGESTKKAFERLMDECANARIPYDPFDRVSLVLKDGKTVGQTYLDLMDEGKSVGDEDTVHAIEPSTIVTSSTPIIRFVDIILDSSIHFLVLRDEEFIGSIQLADLSKMPFRLCLLALTLDFESIASMHTQKDSDASWDILPDGRKGSAMGLYRSKLRDNPNWAQYGSEKSRLLSCISYSDTVRIMKESSFFKVQFPLLISVLDKSIEFRNLCAHGVSEADMYELLKSVNLKEFIQLFRDLNHELYHFVYDHSRRP